MTDRQGNLLYVVCQPCEKANETDFGIKLAVRSRIGWYEQMAPMKALNAWFAKHAKCGGRCNPDHFMLGHGFERNHDQSALEAAVKLAVVQ